MFLDRRVELNMLESEWASGRFSLVVVYGRRRVGKTALLRRFMRGKRGVYYVAAELPADDLYSEFAAAVGEQLGIYVPIDLVEALERLAALHERLVVVLDEFQYMVEADPSLPSRLQRSIDSVLSESKLMLILCGSAVSFFEKKLLGYRAPLFGRRSRVIRLRPMRLIEAHGFYRDASDPLEELAMYSVLGGTPAYASHARGARSLEELLERVLEPGHPLLTEPLDLLRQELREPRTYLSLLRAVAEGRVTPSEAAQAAGVDPRTVHHYISTLEQLDILERRTPLGSKRGSRLYIRDPFFRYWFTVTPRVQSLVEAGYTARAVEIASRLVRERLLGPILQQVVEELLPELHVAGVIPTPPVEHGPWWKKDMEIDMVVRDPGSSTTFIEVKLSIDSRDAARLLERLERLATYTGLQSPVNHYLVVAGRVEGQEEPVRHLDSHHAVVDFTLLWPQLVKEAESLWSEA
ncbi:DUF234 DEXX-box ATPase [Pyrolobus fumarii 1A]|uniref:DUF234 DEXX-box ATPase n=1 Tax=Pyrolobus fumarii (strain DSM 11204 / 1A) TaxID=694429 RepID=G0EFX1_PYRF1|nr:ATP-binding protein [Pyrolobus fumarii]AEM39072.1 DUF234 DEXX-box ATPase [Pyrolobus fumarii 1A]